MSTPCNIDRKTKILDELNLYLYNLEAEAGGNMLTSVDLGKLNKHVEKKLKIKYFKLGNYISSPGFKESLINVFSEHFLDLPNELNKDAVVSTKSNVGKNFSSLTVTDMFHSSPLAGLYFEGSTNEKMVKNFIIGDANSNKYITTDAELSNNLNNLKNQLFRDIQQFLINKNLVAFTEVKDLYDSQNGQVLDYGHYKVVMKSLDDYFFSGSFDMLTSRTGKKIPILKGSLSKNSEIYDAYNAGILLANFDIVLTTMFSDIVNVNYNYFNDLTSAIGSYDKYALKIKGITTIYWNNNEHMSETSEHSEGHLTKILISSIPVYNKKGVKTTKYLDMKNFYLFAAKVSNFELLHGNTLRNREVSGTGKSGFNYFNVDSKESLNWYLDKIVAAMSGETLDPDLKRALRESFADNYEFVISLQNFLSSPENNIAVKESNSRVSLVNMLTQVINNNFGASYYKYDASGKLTVQEMYKQNFNNIQVQNSTFGKMFDSSAIKDMYNLNNGAEAKKLNSLFESASDQDLMSNISQAMKAQIGKYIGEKTGITLSAVAVDDVIEDLERAGLGHKIGVVEFKNRLKSMIYALNADFNGEKFREAIDNKEIRKSKGDVTVGEYLSATVKDSMYIAVRNAYLINYIVMPVMTIETLTGEKLPTFKIGNLTYKDTELFELQRMFESNNPTGMFKSLLIEDTPVVLGTGTKLEATNKDVNKSAVKFSVSESYISDFQFEFLKSIINADTFSIVLGNYSDKNAVLTKIISAKHSKSADRKPIISIPIDGDGGILETMRSQGRDYYYDTLYNVFNDYKTIFDKLSIPNTVNLANFEKSFDANVQNINSILKDHNIRDLVKKYNNSNPEKVVSITDELHFSKYGKITSLNQLLVDNYRIFSDSSKGGLFSKFVAMQEASMVEKFKEFNKGLPLGDNDLNLGDRFSSYEMKSLLEKLGLTDADFSKDEGGKVLYTKLADESGKLNPIIKKWLWSNALYRNEYMFISGKGEYMHPHKLGKEFPYRGDSGQLNFGEFAKEMSGRLSSMAKRNVMFTSTFEAPVRNSKLGVPDVINHAVIEDSSAHLFNLAGDIKANQDAFDGSSFMDYTYSLMLDESYPKKGYTGTKKQFGSLVSPNGVTIKKDAESVITNDKILKSKKSQVNFLNQKKQMLGLSIEDVMMDFKDKSIANKFHYNHLGKTYTINGFEINGNKYTLDLLDNGIPMDPIEGKLTTLYDLWKLFGGEYSTDAEGNFNEGSNELLYEVITTPNREGEYVLKNRMIHVISNLSAVKAGASNVNSADS